MTPTKVWISSFAPALLVACGTIDRHKDDTAALLNPPKIHGAFDTSSRAYKAALVPIDDYYNALSLAKSAYATDASGKVTDVAAADQEKIQNYVSEGIGLVDSYCGRWFQSLDDMNRLLAFQNKNVNVISQLGTTLLGLGSANTYFVTGYGALNTAYAGASENFNSAFLVTPTASKVKEHIESVMKDEAEQMRTDSASLNFKQAYNRLEKYAGYCTHARAKEIVDTALNITKTELNATGQPETVRK